MSRIPRVKTLDEDEIYSISTKTNQEKYIFDASKPENIPNIELFLDIFYRAKNFYQFTSFGFAVMSNHIHLMFKPNLEKGDISAIMRWINGNFSREYNKMHKKRGGHNWKERFSSKIVRGKQHFRNSLRYFIMNPVRAGIVNDPMDHPYHLGHTIMEADLENPRYSDLVDLDEIAKEDIDYIQRFIRRLKSFLEKNYRKGWERVMKILRKRNPIYSFLLSKKRSEQFYKHFSGSENIVRELRKLFNLDDYGDN